MRLLEQYWVEEPWGPVRDNIHAGMIAAVVANSGFRKFKKSLSATDFMLKPREREQQENRGSLLALFRAIATKKEKNK